jgi:hypothetical protein
MARQSAPKSCALRQMSSARCPTTRPIVVRDPVHVDVWAHLLYLRDEVVGRGPAEDATRAEAVHNRSSSPANCIALIALVFDLVRAVVEAKDAVVLDHVHFPARMLVQTIVERPTTRMADVDVERFCLPLTRAASLAPMAGPRASIVADHIGDQEVSPLHRLLVQRVRCEFQTSCPARGLGRTQRESQRRWQRKASAVDPGAGARSRRQATSDRPNRRQRAQHSASRTDTRGSRRRSTPAHAHKTS